MKPFSILCLLVFSAFSATAQLAGPPSGNNQKAVVGQYMGPVSVYITYNSPDVTSPQGQDRRGKIWGQLVPYGLNNLGFGNSSDEQPSPWRAGANENTVIKFSHDVLVEGKPLKAGKYGLHMIPGEEEWVVIFSNNYSAWGSYYYEPKDDALRVSVTPKENDFHEWLDFEFVDRQPDATTFELQWENLAIPVKVEVESVAEIYVDMMDKQLISGSNFTWQDHAQAANYAATNNVA
ncbi:MAG: DUF2911 domain-containing protein, partial [Saprospiraceae bacterium]|nr:DUF2911 domain-containing protein [Saprospiraceae bacterium]